MCIPSSSNLPFDACLQHVLELHSPPNQSLIRADCPVVVCDPMKPHCSLADPSSQDFLRRSEAAFRALHQRVLLLEQQQASQGPSDEQLERVLRKILAERFGNTGSQIEVNQDPSINTDYFVRPPENDPSIRAPPISPSLLLVDPEAVPSKAYGHTFQMLEKGLSQYPQVDDVKPVIREDEDTCKRSEHPPNHGRPW